MTTLLHAPGIEKKLGIPQLATGDMLRAAVGGLHKWVNAVVTHSLKPPGCQPTLGLPLDPS